MADKKVKVTLSTVGKETSVQEVDPARAAELEREAFREGSGVTVVNVRDTDPQQW